MVNGLKSYTDKYPTGTKEDIDIIYGYWSLSSYDTYSYATHGVYYEGEVRCSSVGCAGNNDYGVRPVIEVPKSKLQ